MTNRPVFVLATLLAFVLACDGDGDSTRAPTSTATAETALATSRPEGSATAEPTATRVPATATPSATPSPTPRAATEVPPELPTATATPRPDGLQFHFGPGVSNFDRSLIERAVEVTSELLSQGADVRPPAAVFAGTSPLAIEEDFKEHALAQTWRSEGMAHRITQTVAEASYRGIVINTGSPAWQELGATERLRAVAHEFVHVIQLERAGKSAADETLSGPILVVPPIGPFWLLEGSAEVVSWLVIQELGLGSYPEPLFDYAADASRSTATLQEMESFIGYRQAGKEGLALAILAADYLLRSRDLEALFDFWGEIGRGTAWSTAFTREFGQAPVFFYPLFQSYYDTVWAGFGR